MTFLGNHTKILTLCKLNYKGVKTYSYLYNNRLYIISKLNQLNSTNANNHQLGYYLAGLIEGDGSIILRKGEKESVSPKIVFTYGKNEIFMYEKLNKILNTGVIYKEKNEVYRYSITSSEAVIRIINLINGKFRTPKILALHHAIDNLNKWREANLLKLPLDTSSLDSNAWLAGFIDADGHFSIKLTGSYGSDSSESRGRVQCIFSINQSELNRTTGESNVNFMTELAEFFKVNLNRKICNSLLFKNPSNMLVFFAQSDRKHYIITTYLSKFPLMSSKHLNYLSFYKGLNYLGKRLTREEIIEIRDIKNSMNNQRTEFNWYHLNNLNIYNK
uniref:Homing endonuclease LAGLIDADG domain-containing protein n=1 Tax=Tolypocladium guangdongense TaxID=2730933 RepID=A0A7S8WWJ2_9HYPO|nr:hypothetical protein J6816_mgp04 [Tolypocladium guangdongense]QPF24431.1 hypothetical protein [Tolypocladium guangdongense]